MLIFSLAIDFYAAEIGLIIFTYLFNNHSSCIFYLGRENFVQCIKNIKSSLLKDHFKETSWQHKYEVVQSCIIIENIFAETNLVKLVNSVRPFCPLKI